MGEQDKWTLSDGRDLEWNEKMVKDYDEYIKNKKTRREELQKEKSAQSVKSLSEKMEYYKQFFLTSEEFEEYEEKISKCIYNNKNIRHG